MPDKLNENTGVGGASTVIEIVPLTDALAGLAALTVITYDPGVAGRLRTPRLFVDAAIWTPAGAAADDGPRYRTRVGGGLLDGGLLVVADSVTLPYAALDSTGAENETTLNGTEKLAGPAGPPC